MRYFVKLDGDKVVVAKAYSEDDQEDGYIEVDFDAYAAAVVCGSKYVGGAVEPYTPPPAPPARAYTGRDIVDGLSAAQAKAANDVDPRDLMRVAAASYANTVKSCIARAEHNAGVPAGTFVKQATPTG